MESKKLYTWEEIKELLIRKLKKTKHIMTFGTIGSCNIDKDIDVIITKKPTSKTSEFYKEIHNLFDNISGYLTKHYGSKLIRFNTMTEEQILIYLKSYRENDLGFHTMIYFSYPQIKIDWASAQNFDIKKFSLKEYNCFFGSPKDLFSKEFQEENPYDPTYNFLFNIDKINSHYPQQLYINLMNRLLNYLSTKRLKFKSFKINSKSKAKKVFYQLCDKLDELNKEKS